MLVNNFYYSLGLSISWSWC